MSKIPVIFFVGFLCVLKSLEIAGQKPPEATLPGDRIKPKVELSLLRPENPHVGDDIQLECSAKPKDRTDRTKPDDVHWIKGNVGVPQQGQPGRPDSDRFIREVVETDKGTVLFLLTIKDAEKSDEDKYMCIVQVGVTGYFTSNEVQLDIEAADPGREKVTVETSESGEYKSKHSGGSKIDQLTPEETNILRRKDEIADMSEDELMLLSKAMKKDKQIKKQREEEEKREEQERLDRIRQEAEKRAEKRKPKLELTQEESDILKRKADLANMAPEELQLLQQALKKERDIEAQKKEEETKLTKEEEAILKRKDQIRDMTQDELKLMASAVTKQKKLQEEKRPEEDLTNIPTKTKVEVEVEPLTQEEVYILTRKDDIMDLSAEELSTLSRAMKKEKDLKDKNPDLGDAMSEDEMLNILDKKGEIMNMSREELDQFIVALVKQNKLRLPPRQKVNDPLENEEAPSPKRKEEL